VVVALFAAVALAGVVAIAVFHAREGRPVPSFPSLAEHPDPSLHGTVAYFDPQRGCVRLVAAAGAPSKDLYCLPAEGPSNWVKVGKPAGPQLVWRDDGRLEITMFRMVPRAADEKSPPALEPGWQKIVDPRTGKVEDVPTADLPPAPITTAGPSVNPRGERVTWSADQLTGRVEVKLTDAHGTRTLLAAHGPGEYGYRFGPVFWAPTWKWVAASDDGRILVITPTDPAVTRVLVANSGGGAGGGTAGPEFAVTAADLLPPAQ
jgi:hypothetical protein